MSGEKPSGSVRHEQAGPSDPAPVQGLPMIIIVTKIIMILSIFNIIATILTCQDGF